MKKKIVSLLVSAIMVATSALPAFATTKLNRPVIDSISHTSGAIYLYGCQYLRQSCIAISKSSAVSSGYTACSVCW